MKTKHKPDSLQIIHKKHIVGLTQVLNLNVNLNVNCPLHPQTSFNLKNVISFFMNSEILEIHIMPCLTAHIYTEEIVEINIEK